jgi:hypothetical protein
MNNETKSMVTPSQFESLINDFEVAVSQSQINADDYALLLKKLDNFELKYDEESKVDPINQALPNTIRYSITALVSRLSNVNRKNSEIIQNLRKLL